MPSVSDASKLLTQQSTLAALVASQSQAVTLAEPAPEDLTLAEADSELVYTPFLFAAGMAAGKGAAGGALTSAATMGISKLISCYQYDTIVVKKVKGKSQSVPI